MNGMLVRFVVTLMVLSRNVVSFNNNALGTKLGSANSMYANLPR